MDELDEDDGPADPFRGLDFELRIRVSRDGAYEVSLDGEQLPVEKVDIDEISLERLGRRRRTVRD